MRYALLTPILLAALLTPAAAQKQTPPAKPAPAARLAPLAGDAEKLRDHALELSGHLAPMIFNNDLLWDQAFELSSRFAPMNFDFDMGHFGDLERSLVGDLSGRLAPMTFDFDLGHLADLEHDLASELSGHLAPMYLPDVEGVRAQAEAAATDAVRSLEGGFPSLSVASMPAPRVAIASGQDRASGVIRLRPVQGTQEDSLYRAARAALNQGDYLQAASMFRDFERQYPRSRFAPAALYWQAFALYRVGSTERLREALVSLATQREKYPQTASDADVAALNARVQSALAQRGDPDARRVVQAQAAEGSSCDKEEMEVRAEALNALIKMEANSANDLVTRILDRKDECSVTLRRRAVYILGRSGTAESGLVLLNVAKTDPSLDVRSDAISMLGRSASAATVAALEEIVRTNSEERLQRAALNALKSTESPAAITILRRFVENQAMSERLRASALSSMMSGRSENRNVDEESAYLRGLYNRVDGRSMKQTIIGAIGRFGGTANEQWLLALARNPQESSTYRSYALGRLRSKTFPIEEVVRLYDTMTERSMRESVINLLVAREEPAATDKLIEIVRRGTDPRLRSAAINGLSRKKDPRTQQLLLELVEKP